MKIKHIILLLITVLLGLSCKKDPPIINLPTGEIQTDTPEFIFTPCSFMIEPSLGWTDSTKSTERDITRALINPLNKNEIIYTAGYQMYNYNIITKIRKKIYNNVTQTPSTPSINQFGWITFNNSRLETCIIKSNGDSLKILSPGALYPLWSYTGKEIYFTQYGTLLLFKIDINGQNLDTILGYSILGVTKLSRKIVTIRPSLSQLFMKDLNTGFETTLITGDPHYYFLNFDNKDENIYWSNDNGVYKFNIAASKLDTLVKACPVNMVTPQEPNSYVSATNVSPNSDKLTFIFTEYVQVSTYKRYTVAHLLQMDLATKKITEIKLFD